MRTFTLLALIVLAGSRAEAQINTADVSQELRTRLEQLRVRRELQLQGERVAHTQATLGLYEARTFAPLWASARSRTDLLRVVREVRADGLDPDHYHLTALEAALPGWPGLSPRESAALDLLLTDALVRVAHDLRFGKLEPAGQGTGRDLSRPLRGTDAVAALLEILESGRLYEEVSALRSGHFVYRGLVRALADLRRIQAAGGWEPISAAGPALRLDSLDARVPLLRRRLAQEGYPGAGTAGADPRMDAALEAAVRVFQHRHGLNEDGVVGAATLAELNVPVERRIDQVRLNLERARWVTLDLPSTFLVVNIAGAKVFFVREGHVAFETRTVVGATYTRTPVFRALLRTIDLNPTWTVPPGIVDEVLARAVKDPGYLSRESIRVLDGSRRLDPAAIDFSRYSASTFPYTFRQDPGVQNALGSIKFLFPNPYNVYLHDTPSKSLFEREQRTFSHGCIRVQDPLSLAVLVLDDPARWNRASLEAAIAEGVTRTIELEEPIPVIVQYWTASADERGELHFYRDVYRRDAALLEALDAP